mmetsp:Transcript_56019/g.181604  ORF Transcript_56019/g.181604 Transcript_56019/m.181604 type:complete len:228 (+) Transcript_56019:111-794(+)
MGAAGGACCDRPPAEKVQKLGGGAQPVEPWGVEACCKHTPAENIQKLFGKVEKNDRTPIKVQDADQGVSASAAERVGNSDLRENNGKHEVKEPPACQPKNGEEYAYPDGSTYKGEWHDNKRHGHGVQLHKNGSRYEGSWMNDKTHGHGREMFTTATGRMIRHTVAARTSHRQRVPNTQANSLTANPTATARKYGLMARDLVASSRMGSSLALERSLGATVPVIKEPS